MLVVTHELHVIWCEISSATASERTPLGSLVIHLCAAAGSWLRFWCQWGQSSPNVVFWGICRCSFGGTSAGEFVMIFSVFSFCVGLTLFFSLVGLILRLYAPKFYQCWYFLRQYVVSCVPFVVLLLFEQKPYHALFWVCKFSTAGFTLITYAFSWFS